MNSKNKLWLLFVVNVSFVARPACLRVAATLAHSSPPLPPITAVVFPPPTSLHQVASTLPTMDISTLKKFVTTALKASRELFNHIPSNQPDLKKVLIDHLETLDGLAKLPDIGTQLDVLKTPLLQCATTCTVMLSYFTQHDVRPQNFQKASYNMQNLLAAYSSTIAVVLVATNR
jgi:hypothetical protein